jgi:hypothetical protein
MYDGALCPQRKHRALSTAVTVYCPHHANPHERRRASERRHQHQGLHCRLPFRRGVLDLRKLCDVVAGVLKGDELAAVRPFDWIVEWPSPTFSAGITPWTQVVCRAVLRI